MGSLAALLTLRLAQTAAGANGPEILRFDTHGGDAWTFSKVISGTVTRPDCEAVTLLTTRGRVSAQITQNRFTATVALREGSNSVRAICVSNGRQVGAIARQNWIERLPDTPSARATVTVEGDSVLIDARQSTVAPGVAAPLARYSWRAAAAPAFTAHGHGPLLRLRSPKIDGDYYVTLTVTDAAGRSGRSTVMFRVAGGKTIAVDASRDRPDWRACTILYGVVPSLLGKRGLSDITRHLDQIARLGVTALWVSPVTGAPPGDFGYALTDPFHVRPDLGSSHDLQNLVMRAHAHGMRVLLDFVTNHLSRDHPYFEDAARFGRRSPYFDWFERDPSGHPEHYFDWSSLENLNYGNAEVRNYIMAAVTHWFRDFPIDGFRADAAWAVRERAPAFWPLLQPQVRRIRPQALLLAEASARDSYYMSHGFDAAYDWTAELGQWAWQGVFGPPGQLPNLGMLRAALTNEGHGFPDNSGVLHFLNNNDTGKRFITVHGLVNTRLAAALLLTLPGIPLVYAGDEVGASFEPYTHPAPINWNDPDHLLPLYMRLTKLRRQTPALRSPRLRLIRTSRDDSILAYTRGGADPAQDVIVALNFGATSFDLPLAPGQAKSVSPLPWWGEDLLTGTLTVATPDAQTIRVAPRSALLVGRETRPTATDDPATPSASLCSSMRAPTFGR